MVVTTRSACESDQCAIVALVRSERLNPTQLEWRNFIVATDETGIIGAVQIRTHVDGSREVGSLVVRPRARGVRIATRLMDAVTASDDRRLFAITGAAFAAHYEQWGFRTIAPHDAPRAVRRNFRLGTAGGLLALLRGRRPRRLVILTRPERTAQITTKPVEGQRPRAAGEPKALEPDPARRSVK